MTQETPIQRKDEYGFPKTSYEQEKQPDETTVFNHEEYGEIQAELYGDRIEVYETGTGKNLTCFRNASSDVALQVFEDIENNIQDFLEPELDNSSDSTIGDNQ